MSRVTLSQLTVRYSGGATGLDAVDLDIADGEFVALVGPSGSGKTTLLRSIAGFVSPISGSIRFGDDLVADAGKSLPPEDRALGMVFQQHAVWPHLSVGRNVEYPLRRAGVGRAERARRVADALDLVGLAGTADRAPATLSGGQRQRVALARAVVAQPRVLLLDEALSALDEPLRDSLRLELRALAKAAGLTVVHVTHDRAEALALADRVAVLDRGRIVQVGTPADLTERPATPEVARFLSDAVLLDGVLGAGGFVAGAAAGAAGLRVAREHVVLAGATGSDWDGTGAGRLAVLPRDVGLGSAGSAPDGARAHVVSSLYGRDGNDVVVDLDGVRLRAVASDRPAPGDVVGVELARGLFFPA